jgi:hypothetical protein
MRFAHDGLPDYLLIHHIGSYGTCSSMNQASLVLVLTVRPILDPCIPFLSGHVQRAYAHRQTSPSLKHSLILWRSTIPTNPAPTISTKCPYHRVS